VLNARAETSQAVFDMESADGDEKIARVVLAEEVGAEPSANVTVDAMTNAPLPDSLTSSVEELIERAIAGRPDLAAQAAEFAQPMTAYALHGRTIFRVFQFPALRHTPPSGRQAMMASLARQAG